ncbi:MAG: patatin-like phospholipase family protein [Candidatus Omnitrophica bacterium]|nr:patatin-like phospholipase family protein [Candidatus Omnitrophota bacterium]
MDTINEFSLFKDIPLFAGLSDEELALIKSKSSLAEYKKGSVIYSEGDPPGAFYCIILGRILIFTTREDGSENILEYLHRGQYFGIISLLTHEPHSVSVRSVNDCVILVIGKEDFDLILNRIPRLAIDLSQTLSRRLKRKDIHRKTIFESTIISIFSSYSQTGKTLYALNLALSLKGETHKSVIILDIAPQDKIHSLPHRLGVEGKYETLDLSTHVSDLGASLKRCTIKDLFGIDLACIFYKPEDGVSVKRVVDLLILAVNDYHYIILDLPSFMDPSVLAILNQADLIHILTSPEPVDLERTHNLVERLKKDFRFQENKIKVLINEYKLSKLDYEEQAVYLQQGVFATLPKIEFGSVDRLILDEPVCEYSKAVRRISRQLGERLVGLALGVGVGYGLCHVGVLKVIEEEKIPIDVIAGSSIGALLASLWVTGRSSGEILEITKEFKDPRYIWNVIDLTFPWLGFIKGNKLYRFLKKYLGNKTFADVRLPLKIIASDIKRKESRVLDKGPLVDAIMASCAMPGVFAPFKEKEDLLLDGGIINPLPTEALFKMGASKIIAVNVTPSRQDIMLQYEKIKEELGGSLGPAFKKSFSIRNYFKNKLKNNILDIIFSSIEVMQSEMAEREAQLADVVLHPDTQGLYWLELHRAAEFTKRGEEEARRNLDKIWRIINE